MTSYLDASLPTRSEHLWRYTPWSRVHPTKVNELPSVGELVIESGETEIKQISKQAIKHDGDIARIFLDDVVIKTHVLTPETETTHVQIRAGGHAVAAHLHIESSQSSSVMLHLSGEAEWVGLWLTGNIRSNSHLSVGLVNELSSDSVFVRTDDWNVERDGDFELATLRVLGASTRSLGTMLLFESLLIGVIGGIVGVLFAYGGAVGLAASFSSWQFFVPVTIVPSVAWQLMSGVILIAVAMTPFGVWRLRKMDLVEKVKDLSS